MDQAQEIEPELLSPPPRPIRPKTPPTPTAHAIALTFKLTVLLLMLGWLADLSAATMIFLYGAQVPGTVEALTTSGNADVTTYSGNFSYTANRRQLKAELNIPQDSYYKLSKGQSTYLKILPAYPAFLPQFGATTAVDAYGFLWGWTICLYAIIYFVYVVALVIPRRLVTHGTPATGVIADKQDHGSEHNKKVREYFITYSFEVSGPGDKTSVRKRQIEVQKRDWDSIDVGDKLTVLYNPKLPHSSIPYRFSRYGVTSDNGSPIPQM